MKERTLARTDGDLTFTYDITDSTNPQPTGVVSSPGANSLSLGDSTTVYVGTDLGLVVSLLTDTSVGTIADYTFALPNQVESDPSQSGIVFTANNFVIETFDLSDPFNPASLGFHAITGIEDFVVGQGRAVALQSSGGMHVLDVSDPASIVLTAFLGAILGSIVEISDSGDCGMVSLDDTVTLFDLSDPQNPTARGSYTFDGEVLNFFLNESIAVVNHTTAVTVLDITDKDDPVELARYEGLPGIFALSQTSADAFMSVFPGKVSQIDTGTGAPIGSLDIPLGGPGLLRSAGQTSLKAPGDIYYLTDESGTLLVLDWTDPTQPRIVGEISGPDFAPRAMTVTANMLVIAEDVGPGRLSLYPTHGTSPTAVPGVSAQSAPTVLRSVYPNPTPGLTNILLEMPHGAAGSLAVYDLRGRRLQTIFTGRLTPGMNLLSWDGRDAHGVSVAAGRYFVRATFGDRDEARPVTVLR